MKTALLISALTLGSVMASQAATTLIGGDIRNGNLNLPSNPVNPVVLNTTEQYSWTGAGQDTKILAKLTNNNVLSIQPDGTGKAQNMTTHPLAVGDFLEYGFEYLSVDDHDDVTMSLVYKDGSSISTVPGSEVTVNTQGTHSYNFTVTANSAWVGKEVGIRIEVLGRNPRLDLPTEIDNIKVTVAAVPEPSSTALLGLGGVALLFRRRK